MVYQELCEMVFPGLRVLGLSWRRVGTAAPSGMQGPLGMGSFLFLPGRLLIPVNPPQPPHRAAPGLYPDTLHSSLLTVSLLSLVCSQAWQGQE